MILWPVIIMWSIRLPLLYLLSQQSQLVACSFQSLFTGDTQMDEPSHHRNIFLCLSPQPTHLHLQRCTQPWVLGSPSLSLKEERWLLRCLGYTQENLVKNTFPQAGGWRRGEERRKRFFARFTLIWWKKLRVIPKRTVNPGQSSLEAGQMKLPNDVETWSFLHSSDSFHAKLMFS